MKKTKKLVSFLLILWAFWISYVSANNENKIIAENYLKENSEIEFYWKWTNPKIVSEKNFFNDNDKKASYIEYKVSCDKEKDCWYIIVNIDNTDVPVPMSSSSWKTISEIMNSWDKNTKNYYFSPFEQFSENEKTWEINFTNPNNQELIEENNFENWYSTMSLNSKNFSKNNKLKEKLDSLKEEAKEYKKSEDFKEEIKKINFSEFGNYSTMRYWDQSSLDEFYWMKTINWAWWWKDCPWKLPCYEQNLRDYWIIFKEKCLTWCWATSFAMVFWYYSRIWKFEKLLPWISIAPLSNNQKINNIQKEISKSISTFCNNWEWWVNGWWMEWIKNYIKKYNYNVDIDNYRPFDFNQNINLDKIFNKVQTEIMNNRPIILYLKDRNWKWWHLVTAFWYSSKTNHKRINVNFWRGKEHSNVNMALDSIYRWDYSYTWVWYFSLKLN